MSLVTFPHSSSGLRSQLEPQFPVTVLFTDVTSWLFYFTHTEDRFGKGGLGNHPASRDPPLQLPPAKENLRTLTIFPWTITKLTFIWSGFLFSRGQLSVTLASTGVMLKVRKTRKDCLAVDSSFTLCCQTTKVNRMSGFKLYMPTSHWMMLRVCIYISALISSSVPVRMDYFLDTFTAVHWHHDHVISVWHMLISYHLFVLGETWHFVSLRQQVCTQKWCRLLSNINKLFAIIFCILVDLNADECVLWSTVWLWGGR